MDSSFLSEPCFDGIKAADTLFEENALYLSPDTVELELLFCQYDSAANSILIKVRGFDHAGEVIGKFEELLEFDCKKIMAFLKEELEYWKDTDVYFWFRLESDMKSEKRIWDIYSLDRLSNYHGFSTTIYEPSIKSLMTAIATGGRP